MANAEIVVLRPNRYDQSVPSDDQHPRWSKTILIVEDDGDLRHMFADALKFSGFSVQEAANGLEALRMIEDDPPDLVVLDVVLPVLDGLSVRDEILAHARTRDIPIVVVTGSVDEPGKKLRADCVLRKPVAPDTLVATVRKCL